MSATERVVAPLRARVQTLEDENERLRTVIGVMTLMGVKPRRSLRRTLAEIVSYGESHRYPQEGTT